MSFSVFFGKSFFLRFQFLKILLTLQFFLNDVHLLDLILALVPLADLLEVLLLEHADLALHHNLVVLLLARSVNPLLVLLVLLLYFLLDVLHRLPRISPNLPCLVLNVKLVLLNPLPSLLLVIAVQLTLQYRQLYNRNRLQFSPQFLQGQWRFFRLSSHTCEISPF